MICFHFTIFVVLTTTKITNPKLSNGCDLLSFYYLCRTDNNHILVLQHSRIVVICFHFTIFVVLTTTPGSSFYCRVRLWFAFILLSLSYWQQRLRAVRGQAEGCDLLSFYYLCRTDNNNPVYHTTRYSVVICFHFTIFVVLTTTRICIISWISVC